MKITNKYGLDESFVRAAENDPYDAGNSDFTASQISGWETPRGFVLKEQAGESLEVDVSDLITRLLGQGTHAVLQRAARPGIDLCEVRYYAKFPVDGTNYVVSCRIDLFNGETSVLYDWKTAQAYALSGKAGSGKKPDWIAQLNMEAEILRRQEQPIIARALKINALLKDWDYKKAGSFSHPSTAGITVDVPMWAPEKTTLFIENQIRARVAARKELPRCTSLETLRGKKCERYCDAASVCSQYKASRSNGARTFDPALEARRLVAEALDNPRPKKSGWTQLCDGLRPKKVEGA